MSTTPTPWRIWGGATPADTAISSADEYVVFSMADREMEVGGGQKIKAPDYETQRANATLIVTAVNSHHALLEACRKALTFASIDSNVRQLIRDAIAVAEQAGRAAKGATTL